MEESSPTKSLLVGLSVLSGFALTPTTVQALSITGVTSTIALPLVTTAGAVAVVVILVKKKDEDSEEESGDKTARLMDLGLVNGHTELPMQFEQLINSPGAFAQMNQESAHGVGPMTLGLAQSTNLSESQVQVLWQKALSQVELQGPASDARQVVDAVAAELVPVLEISPELRAERAWKLARERQDPGFPGNAIEHQGLAQWLGVPLQSVLDASEQTFGDVDSQVREQIYANPTATQHTLAKHIEAASSAEIDARNDALIDLYNAQAAL
jgi:hypothetical protein